MQCIHPQIALEGCTCIKQADCEFVLCAQKAVDHFLRLRTYVLKLLQIALYFVIFIVALGGGSRFVSFHFPILAM